MLKQAWGNNRSRLRTLAFATLTLLLASYTLPKLGYDGSKAANGATDAATTLIDQDGNQISLEQLHGRLVVLNFVYTGCGRICPIQTEQLAVLQRLLPASLRKRVRFLSISVDPTNDSPGTLRRFALLHGADLANWSFVTGEPAALAKVAVSFNAQNRGEGDHSAVIRLIDLEGSVVQRYSGAPVAVNRILYDIRQLALRESAAL